MAAARAPFAEGREMRASSSRIRRYAAEGSRLDNEHGPEWWLGQSARERAGGLESTLEVQEIGDETGTRFATVARPIGGRFVVAWPAGKLRTVLYLVCRATPLAHMLDNEYCT